MGAWSWGGALKSTGRFLTAPIVGTTHTTLEIGRGVRDLDPGRILLAPVRGIVHTGAESSRGIVGIAYQKPGPSNFSIQDKIINDNIPLIRGSNYLDLEGIVLNIARANARLTVEERKRVAAKLNNAYATLNSVYARHADLILTNYRQFLASNNSEEIRKSIINLKNESNLLVSKAFPVTRNSALYKGRTPHFNTLISKLQSRAKNIAESEITFMQEQQQIQKGILQYEMAQAGISPGGGFDFKKLLIPAALGTAAVIAFKG
jgi:hypothetical protein